MSADLIEDRIDDVLLLTLNRPRRRNALTRDLIAALHDRIRFALEDAHTGAIVISGAPPAFSAGMDLSIVAADEDGAQHCRPVLAALLDLYTGVCTAEKPIIAAVNGAAVAGGAGLVSACDIAIAAESAVIGYPEIRHGVVAAIVMPFLQRCVGQRRARHLLLTGALLSAEQALSTALVSECTPDHRCVPRAVELAGQLAAYPQGAFARTKRIFQQTQTFDPLSESAAARDLYTQLSLTDQARQNLERFLDG